MEFISINWYNLVHFKWLSLKLPGCNRTPKEGDFNTSTRAVKLLYQHSCTSGIDGCMSGQRSWHHHHCHGGGCAWRPCDQTLSECSPIPKHLTGVLHVPIWHSPEDRLAKLTRGRKHLQLQSNKWVMSFVYRKMPWFNWIMVYPTPAGCTLKWLYTFNVLNKKNWVHTFEFILEFL